ncbi:Zap1p NDAI_0G05800 [Naumovozyma dairenensis CBS 421]|uniref:C2H2-type domain-containing protein n=1 Tax=Naumovozyma dairenensis (strain ATCC 10597 / BCRC 20456 / CBS 421 / NBRC 0211 / NRRL Y-12639) TaxID=1071378 RepID=J7SB55_NAUDC|nr:hypothetical protein NDAI_0G05800 [Naumovozyma dairenensis CBS 421]CCK73563.1 hypothetical protein NDAI_0G05800 [Naumovozyma dairenensis CBS 421]
MPNTQEGIVHGHIHNHDNLTYIHGHVHVNHNAGDRGSGATDATGQTLSRDIATTTTATAAAAATSTDNTEKSSSTGNILGSCNQSSDEIDCTQYADCQHFEFINYHRDADRAINNDPISSSSILPKDFSYHDDTLLLPSANLNSNVDAFFKRRKLDPMVSTITHNNSNFTNNNDSTHNENCYCNPKVLEICCEMDHHLSEYSKEDIKAKNSGTFSDYITNLNLDELNIYTGIQNTNPLKNSSLSTKSSDHSNDIPYKDTITEINCDLTCDTQCHPQSSINSQSKPFELPNADKNIVKTEDDKQDLNVIIDQFCKHCNSHDHLTSAHDTTHPSLQRQYHEHIVNSQTDLKILEDLCDISTLYEVPFANHMNHHNHIHSSGQNQSINLLHSSISKTPPSNDNNAYTTTTITTNNNNIPNPHNHDHTNLHHHHRIQLHPHKEAQQQNKFKISTVNASSPIAKTYSYERSKHMISTEPDKFYHYPPLPLATNDVTTSTTSTNNNEIFNDNKLMQDNNTVNFNWIFKKNDEPTLKCKWADCTESFNTLLELQKHIIKDHVSLPATTLQQTAKATENGQQDNNNTFINSCNWQDCDYTNKNNDICSLINHINDTHGINFDIKFIEPKMTKINLNSHHSLHCANDTHHLELLSNTTVQPSLPTTIKNNDSTVLPISNKLGTIKCEWGLCDQVFNSKEDLNTHLENDHLLKGQSQYQCHWHGCSKKFTQRQKMVRHLKVHSGYKPCKCPVCNKCFSNLETLKQHQRTHTGEKPFQCHLCDKRFTIASSLKIHIRTHTGEKPLKCKICGKAFNESSNLSKHIKTHFKLISTKQDKPQNQEQIVKS